MNVTYTYIKEENSFLTTKVYPNPSSGIIILEIDNPTAEKVELNLLNLNGQVIFRRHLSNNTAFVEKIDMAKFSTGVYSLIIKGFTKITTKRIVIY